MALLLVISKGGWNIEGKEGEERNYFADKDFWGLKDGHREGPGIERKERGWGGGGGGGGVKIGNELKATKKEELERALPIQNTRFHAEKKNDRLASLERGEGEQWAH